MPEESPIRILCIEDHPVFRLGIETIVSSQADMQLVGSANRIENGLELYRTLKPDVTLMDLRLPDGDGVDALRRILGHHPAARVVVLTTSDADGDVHRAMRAGAFAYALKSDPKNELVAMIRNVHKGNRQVGKGVALRVAEHFGDDELTARELEVLEFIRDGYRNKQIAAALEIAETTVNFHIKNLTAKLQAQDRAHAVAIGIRRGFLRV